MPPKTTTNTTSSDNFTLVYNPDAQSFNTTSSTSNSSNATSNLTINTSSSLNNWATAAIGTIPSIATVNTAWTYFDDLGQVVIAKYLKEEEIVDILEKIKSRISDDEFKKVVSSFVRNRHFSEKFLLDYALGRIEKTDILLNHAAEITTGEYSAIALAFEAEK